MQKRKKRIEENPNAEIKPFNLRFRKFSEPSVINLPKEKVVVKFVKAEKKVRVEKEEEQMEQTDQIEQIRLSRSDRQKKKQKEKKKRDRERRKQKRESARLLNPPPQPPPPRDENSPNQRVHFFAEFSRVGWCREMKVVEENAPVEYGIRLCGSKKVVEQILENDCENVVQTRLRYNPKTKEHFIDAVIKVPKTSEDKEGEIVVGGTDPGNTPFMTFYCGSTGEYFDESVLSRNGGRDLLIATSQEKTRAKKKKRKEKKKNKRRKSCRIGGAVGKNVVDQAQRNSNGAESRESANAQTMVSGEANVEEEIRESARQFTELQKKFFFHARKERL